MNNQEKRIIKTFIGWSLVVLMSSFTCFQVGKETGIDEGIQLTIDVVTDMAEQEAIRKEQEMKNRFK